MKKVEVIRFHGNDKETLGILVVIEGNRVLFVCKTLELAWKKNQSNISCIPANTYQCIYSNSPHLSKLAGKPTSTYEITNVPSRAGIRIHSANKYNELLGCIALGDVLKDLNGDMELDVLHSGATINEFEKLMNKEQFELTIKQLF